jgi:hypothetical protein
MHDQEENGIAQGITMMRSCPVGIVKQHLKDHHFKMADSPTSQVSRSWAGEDIRPVAILAALRTASVTSPKIAFVSNCSSDRSS